MPEHSREVTIFPENLLDSDDPFRSSDRWWWVVFTKPRQERALARELTQRAIPFYLPLLKHEKVVRGVRRSSFVPLFSGYMFIYASEEERVRCLETSRVARVLPVRGQQEVEHELTTLHRLISSGAPLSIESRWEPGQRVRVRSGPLAGLEGTLIQRRGETRLLVAIQYLQQGVTVDLDQHMLEPVAEPKDFEEEFAADTLVSPPAVYIVWDPEAVGGARYVELVSAIGDFVRSRGGDGVKLIRSRGFGVTSDIGVYHD